MGLLGKLLGMKEKRDPVSLNDRNFSSEVKHYTGACLVDVWGPQCAPCQKLAPVIADLATQYQGKIKVCEINAAESLKTMAKLGVRGTPTVLAFKNGVEIGRVVGWRPYSFFTQMFEKEFPEFLEGSAVGLEAAVAQSSAAPDGEGAAKAPKRARRHRKKK